MKFLRSPLYPYFAWLCFLTFICYPFLSFSQTPLIDSLQYLLGTSKEDTLKVTILNDLSSELVDIGDRPGAKHFSYEAISLSQKLNDRKGQAIAYMNLGDAFSDDGDPNEAIKSYESSLRIREELKDKKGQAGCYNNIGIIHWSQGSYSDALKTLYLSLNLGKDISDTKGMAFAYTNIGNVFYELGNYIEAIKNYQNAYKIYKDVGNKRRMADILNNLGTVYWHQKNYDEALKSFRESLLLYNEEKKLDYTGNTLSNIGNLFFDQGKYNEALKYYRSALGVHEKNDDKRGIAVSYLNIGAVYQKQGNHPEALKNFFISLKSNEALGNKDCISAAYINIGISYRLQKKYKEARMYVNKSLVTAKEINMSDRIKDIYQELSVLDSTINNWEGAYSNYKSYIFIRDSLFSAVNTEQTVTLRMDFQYQQKEDSLNFEHKSQTRLGLILFGVVVIFFLLGFTIYRIRQNSRYNVVKQEALNAQMSDHFISNTMASINHFIQQNSKEKASDYLLLFNRLVRRVMENSFQKQVTLENDLGVLKDYISLERLRFNNENLHLNINLNEEVNPEEILIPPLILQTIVENSIKHGFKKADGGIITISIHERLDKLECTLEDNGMGRTASMLAQLGDKDRNQSHGSGLAKRLTTIFGGSYTIVDLVDEGGIPTGTKTHLTFPLLKN